MALDIRLSKSELAEKIKRRLGAPVVKVELEDIQIYDAIDYAKAKWIKWGAGNATVETYFTTMLLANQNFYDLPVGVTEIVDYDDNGRGYGINTLFTVENFMYSRGAYDGLLWANRGYGSSIISYHIAIDWLKTLDRYTPSIYNYKYHRYTNQLEVQPAPPSGNTLEALDENGQTVVYDSPGYVLVRSYMLEGSHYAGMESNLAESTWKRTGLRSGDSDTNFYTSDWIFDYALAECKIILGRIRSKFAQFNSIGNIGISLDGDQLLQEGIQEKETLEERLRLEESHEGYGISIG
jgi:hypothetical protein